MENIDLEIKNLKSKILQRYEDAVDNTKAQIARDNDKNLKVFEQSRDELIKELDDRLAIIKEFPSVLDADTVVVYPYENLQQGGWEAPVEVDNRILFRLGKGKWKILVMAKKLE
ncbi:MAG: hypothetical protein PHH85_01920 [Candidatus Methanoperedens sp.]|nr:hypothetical protein [Candidatus Methanoperedens sp.]